ncbi:OsmC family protein [Pelolinea submarina]|uniref:Putative redox protein n=1 Tax=Pelolinea submarina TaxID=913107 RepID=A0A347ZUM8_9CHLR|nr:OsmC family protein [Pelolinea submarina]REG10405.1 putative redox protein [Pelolinea submarina]BBB49009.1 OsmC/Ohr family protein [Pelolinea submarina]
MDAKVIWKNRMSFDGTSDSGFTVPLGTTPEVGGDDDGFRPLELLAVGLAGCTAMDVVSILTKKRQELTSFEVRVHADRQDEHPKVFTHLTIEYVLSGNDLSHEAVERAVQLSAEKYCPAQAMFAKIVPIDLKITIQ